MKLHNLASFAELFRKTGLTAGEVYSFEGRITANLAADLLRQETMWIVEWVGPQQFMVR